MIVQEGATLPVLETTRLLLRPLRLEDALDQYAYARDPDVAGPGMWAPLHTLEENRQDLEETLARQAAGDEVAWGIEEREVRRLVGRCGFSHFRRAHYSAELGYALARPCWGQGLMSEAVQAVMRFGFTALALHRVEAICLAENAASVRVLEKAAFRLEGRARQAYWQGGACHDLLRYALLRSEWVAGHGYTEGAK